METENDNDATTNCECGSWNNLTDLNLFAFEREYEGYCEPSCASQMCGIEQQTNQQKSLMVYVNRYYEVLTRHCDDLLLPPNLPMVGPPYLIKPLSIKDPVLVSVDYIA